MYTFPSAEDAVCTVFGDPHYKTFDGLIYNFQGLCSYILARDCSKSKDFSVHVSNDARLTNSFAWTKSVTVRLKNLKVRLLQKFRVKVNKSVETLYISHIEQCFGHFNLFLFISISSQRVATPYEAGGVRITTSSDEMTLKMLREGVKVMWDGDSYVEVTIPPRYKSNMCGLCGESSCCVEAASFRKVV